MISIIRRIFGMDPMGWVIRRSAKAASVFKKTLVNLGKVNDQILSEHLLRDEAIQKLSAEKEVLMKHHTENAKMMSKIESFING